MAVEERTEDREMSFLEHLEELRSRLIRAFLSVLLGSVVGYAFGQSLISFLGKPVGTLYFFSPPEAFLVRIKVALFAGLFLAMPYVLYQLWAFVKPGLTPRERSFALPLILSGTVLFYLGIAFALFLAVPFGLKVLLAFGGEGMQALIGAQNYFHFLLILLLAFGVLFQFPVVVVILTLAGVLQPETLKRQRRFVILGIFVAAAIITPSVDFITQLILAIPLWMLFEIAVFISSLIKRRRGREE